MHYRTRSAIQPACPEPRRRARSILASLAGLAALTAPAWAAPGLPFTETFDDDSLSDPARTTADWGNAVGGQLRFPSANALSGTTFGPATPGIALPGLETTRMVRLADLDGDGDLDLVEGVAGRSGVYLNNAGTFGDRVTLPGPAANTRGVAVGDIDGDGDLDIALGNFGAAGPSRIYLNAGDGVTYEMQPISQETAGTDYIVLFDADGDGDLDVATANHDRANRLYKNTGDPLRPFGPEGVVGTSIGFAQNTQALAVGDLDNDGDIDVVALNQHMEGQPQQNRYFLNDGTGNFPPLGQAIATDSLDTEGGALGDVNGDGFLDLVIGNTTPPQVSKIYFNRFPKTGDRIFGGDPADIKDLTTPNNPDYGRAVVLEDADNDGDLDVFLSTAAPADVKTLNYLYLNDGTGNFDAGTAIGAEVGNHNSLAVGDINGDGAVDLISGNEARDATGDALPAVNHLYLNGGTAGSGPAVPQLRAHATSLEVDTESTPIASVRLKAAPLPLAPLNKVDFWVSSNGGANWVKVAPNGRPVLFPEGKRGDVLLWRAELAAASPGAAAGTSGAAALGIDSVEISLNASGPTRDPIGDQSATQGTPVTIDAKFTDADDPVFHSLAGLPVGSGLSIDPVTGTISGTPQPVDAASSPISLTVTASDGALTAEQTFTLTVAGLAGNDPPSFTSTPVVDATQDTAYEYAVTAADPDVGDTLTITATTLPLWLTLTDNGAGSATLAGTPTAADVADHVVELQVADAGGATAMQSFTITVAAASGPPPPPPANEAPAFTSTAPTAATEGTELVYAITASDANDGDTLTITGATVPAWLTLTDNGDGTATLSGTPAAADVGDHPVELTVTDSAAATASQAFTITVAAAAPPPPPPPPPPANQSPPPPPSGDGGGGGSSAPWDVLILGALAAAALRRRQLSRRV